MNWLLWFLVLISLGVCVVSCFYHPEGTATWLAERRPDLTSKMREPESIVAGSPMNHRQEGESQPLQILQGGDRL